MHARYGGLIAMEAVSREGPPADLAPHRRSILRQTIGLARGRRKRWALKQIKRRLRLGAVSRLSRGWWHHSRVAALLAVCFLAISAGPANAAVHEISDGLGKFPGMILLRGKIESGDAGLVEILAKQIAERTQMSVNGEPFIIVELDSGGGDVVEAEKIDRIVRARFMMTRVRDNETCASACVLVLAAGMNKWPLPGARIGIHRPRFNLAYFAGLSAGEARTKYDALLADLRAYFAEIGEYDRLYRAMLVVPSASIRFLSHLGDHCLTLDCVFRMMAIGRLK